MSLTSQRNATRAQARVPYARDSMVDALGHEPAKYVSADTAHDLALAAYRRAVRARVVLQRSALRRALPRV
jgi:hypothetical protein